MTRIWTPNRPQFYMAPYGALVAACRPKMQQRAFSPLDIAGLQLWLKADAGLYQDAAMTTPAVSDADPVGGWADQSGQGNHATQATAGSRPILKLAIQNGLPVVRFDGTDDYLGRDSNSGLQISADGITIFVVTQLTVVPLLNASDDLVSKWMTGVLQREYLVTAEDIGGTLRFRFAVRKLDDSATVAVAADTFGAPSAGVPYVVEGHFDPSGQVVGISVNGGTVDTTAITVAALTTASPLGIGYRATPTGYLNGDLAEVILYNIALSSANRQQVYAYLNSRWGVY